MTTTKTKTKRHKPPCDLLEGDRFVPAPPGLKLIEMRYYDHQPIRAGAVTRQLRENEDPFFDNTIEQDLLGWLLPGAMRLSQAENPMPLPYPVTVSGARDPLEPDYPWAVVFPSGWIWSSGAWYEDEDNWYQDALTVMEHDNKVRGRAPD